MLFFGTAWSVTVAGSSCRFAGLAAPGRAAELVLLELCSTACHACAHVLWACPLLPPKTHASPSWYLMFSTGMWQTRGPHCCPKPSQSASLHRGGGKAVFPGRLSHLTIASHEKSCKWCADKLSLTTLLLHFWAQDSSRQPQTIASARGQQSGHRRRQAALPAPAHRQPLKQQRSAVP